MARAVPLVQFILLFFYPILYLKSDYFFLLLRAIATTAMVVLTTLEATATIGSRRLFLRVTHITSTSIRATLTLRTTTTALTASRCAPWLSLELIIYFISIFMKFSEDEIIVRLMNAYAKAREHERSNNQQLRFEINAEEELYDLKNELLKRTYKTSTLICFIVKYPVKREVFAPNFRDRVISHFLFDLINPIFEPTFIYDSYSCRKGN